MVRAPWGLACTVRNRQPVPCTRARSSHSVFTLWGAGCLVITSCSRHPAPPCAHAQCFIVRGRVHRTSDGTWEGAGGDLGDGLEISRQAALPLIKREELAGCVLIN